jgi:hypothetical protein
MPFYKGFVEEIGSALGDGGCLGGIGGCAVILFLVLTLPIICVYLVLLLIGSIARLLT